MSSLDAATAKDLSRTFWDSKVFAAIVTGIFTLLAVFLGYKLSTLNIKPESYNSIVNANAYPFATTTFLVYAGDQVEIQVLGANDVTIDCGRGSSSPIGMIGDDLQAVAVYPAANLCALIGRIGDGPYFTIGAYYKGTAEVTGKLVLGINDVTPKSCGLTPGEACFLDNRGELSTIINITRKK